MKFCFALIACYLTGCSHHRFSTLLKAAHKSRQHSTYRIPMSTKSASPTVVMAQALLQQIDIRPASPWELCSGQLCPAPFSVAAALPCQACSRPPTTRSASPLVCWTTWQQTNGMLAAKMNAQGASALALSTSSQRFSISSAV